MKKTIKTALCSLFLVACCAAAATFATKITVKNTQNDRTIILPGKENRPSTALAAFSGTAGQPVDLTGAADRTVHAVVHIKSTVNGRTQTVQVMPDLFDYMFGVTPQRRQYQTQPQYGYGSGVILSEDGYIVTNNHVIDNADVIEVTLNDSRVFTAELIGTDQNTDLALIRIEADDLTSIPIGNSDDLKLGEWVLAVGNPFNLTSSVTAGVVSAKSRNIGINNGVESVEAFIQTDAAINMGNSGGALVNTRGELVGINSALSSPTGTYAGYGFAIPTTIVKKVVADLKEYGSVQRALLGIEGIDLAKIHQDPQFKDKKFGVNEGVYIVGLADGSGALAADLRKEDIIIELDKKQVRNMAELQEIVVQHRPGDKVSVKLLRDGKEKTVNVELKNSRGNTDIIKKADMEILGASFQEVSDQMKRQLNIAGGMQVIQVGKGLLKDGGIQKGYIILKINNTPIRTLQDIETVYQEASKSQDQVLFISGVFTTGRRANYAISLAQ